jgi:undecaprenyl diphosphate synthase
LDPCIGREVRGLSQQAHSAPAPAVPRHIAIIMDGNGRWATERGLPRLVGHNEGQKNVKRILEHCSNIGVEVLTLYTFSTENWARPDGEVAGLMHLLAETAKHEIPELDENNVRFIVSGRLDEMPDPARSELTKAIEQTKHNTGIVLNVAVNYSGRAEIVDAAKKIARMVADGEIDPQAMKPQSPALSTIPGFPSRTC